MTLYERLHGFLEGVLVRPTRLSEPDYWLDEHWDRGKGRARPLRDRLDELDADERDDLAATARFCAKKHAETAVRLGELARELDA